MAAVQSANPLATPVSIAPIVSPVPSTTLAQAVVLARALMDITKIKPLSVAWPAKANARHAHPVLAVVAASVDACTPVNAPLHAHRPVSLGKSPTERAAASNVSILVAPALIPHHA